MKNIFLLLTMMSFIITCNDKPTVPTNEAPVIQNVSSSPSTSSSNRLANGGQVYLSVTVTDADKDQLSYIWKSSSGSFPNGASGPSVLWQSPSDATNEQSYTIYVTVSDGADTDKDYIKVYVAAPLPTSSIEGYIYYAGTTIAISGVTVSVDYRNYTSNTNGFYKLEDVQIGDKDLRATKDGYDEFNTNITLSTQGLTKDISMTSAEYTHNLYGKIIFTGTQQGVQGVLVTVLNDDGSASTLKTTSDYNGNYQIPTIPQGERTIVYEKRYNSNYDKISATIFMSNSDYQYNVEIEPYTGTVIDINGNEYETVRIGNQWWMAENLKVTSYRNCDAIPNEAGDSDWSNLTTGAWCAYNNDNGNVATYGLLYNWYAVDNGSNIAPAGWHVPTDEEWSELENHLGVLFAGLSLKATSGWSSNNGTNNSGFSALPGGYRRGNTFSSKDFSGLWWSSTGASSGHAWYRMLEYDQLDVVRSNIPKEWGLSVRCIRD